MDTAVEVGLFSWHTEKVNICLLPKPGVQSMRSRISVEVVLWRGVGSSMLTRFILVKMLLGTLPECLVLFLMRCDQGAVPVLLIP